MASSDLPQELLDNIIDHAQDNREALKAIALVHRKLLPRCQKYLFSTVVISTIASCLELNTILLGNPSLQRHIFELDVTCDNSNTLSIHKSSSVLFVLLRKLPNLQQFTLQLEQTTPWAALPDDFRCLVMQVFKDGKLSTIFIRRLHDIPIICFADIIGSHLRSLKLHNISFDGQGIQVVDVDAASSRLALEIRNMEIGGRPDLITAPNSPFSAVDDLTIIDNAMRKNVVMQSAFIQAAKRLRSLTWIAHVRLSQLNHSTPTIATCSSIKNLTALEKFTFTQHLPYDYSFIPSTLKVLKEQFRDVCRTYLTAAIEVITKTGFCGKMRQLVFRFIIGLQKDALFENPDISFIASAIAETAPWENVQEVLLLSSSNAQLELCLVSPLPSNETERSLLCTQWQSEWTNTLPGLKNQRKLITRLENA
ncbi:hypothetical protein Hypma_007075 [Hypsizygus marmoreus]|uniref:F-box domain-containing protein n=1 Tax=Hypsizygus marmoreus TaxID=39966 RepID=A0A369K6T7_HYPMA|nr:hypothetical protein Hypma_007075 [Hypsizygus marmoreus]